jgi:hypothetical protein
MDILSCLMTNCLKVLLAQCHIRLLYTDVKKKSEPSTNNQPLLLHKAPHRSSRILVTQLRQLHGRSERAQYLLLCPAEQLLQLLAGTRRRQQAQGPTHKPGHLRGRYHLRCCP